MRVLFSIAWSKTFVPPSGAYAGDQISIRIQRSDWGLRGLKKLWYHAVESMQILSAARDHDVVVICTSSVEPMLAGALRWLICPRTRIVCFDFLMPRRIWPGKWFLRRLDAIACIRSGDIETLVNRFGVSRQKCDFVPFPSPDMEDPIDAHDDGYVYAAGSSFRDWPTLIDAVAQAGCRAIFSATGELEIPAAARDRIQVLPQQSPENGRRLMARASLVAVSMMDTHLSGGPLILLDAMAMGKAVVATVVNGTRDYFTDETGIGVPPADPARTAEAIRRLMADPDLRQKLGTAARSYVRERFTTDRAIAGIMALCRR